MIPNVTPLTQLILSHNKKRFVKRISSKNVLLNTKKQPVKNQWNFAILLWSVRAKVPKSAGLFMNPNVKPGKGGLILDFFLNLVSSLKNCAK